MKTIALKVDVDTFRGTREGVPCLLEFFRSRSANATFLFSLGADHTGRAIRRLPGHGLNKKAGFSALANYGLAALLYGTLLPGPDIGRRWQDILRSSRIFALKLLCGAAVCSLAYAFAPIPQVERYIGVMFLLFCLPPAANIVALETHYQGTGTSAQYIASGTIASCALVGLYGLALHFIQG